MNVRVWRAQCSRRLSCDDLWIICVWVSLSISLVHMWYTTYIQYIITEAMCPNQSFAHSQRICDRTGQRNYWRNGHYGGEWWNWIAFGRAGALYMYICMYPVLCQWHPLWLIHCQFEPSCMAGDRACASGVRAHHSWHCLHLHHVLLHLNWKVHWWIELHIYKWHLHWFAPLVFCTFCFSFAFRECTFGVRLLKSCLGAASSLHDRYLPVKR